MTGEVPAVHGGHVAGLERAEVARVIPVVEVAPEALEAAHRREGRLEPRRASPGCRASRNRARRPSTAGRARCSWATCDARRPASGPPGSCPGAGQWSAGPTKASKNRQVRRAVERRVRASGGDSSGVGDRRGGRLTHRATSGESPHSSEERRGDAQRWSGRATATRRHPRRRGPARRACAGTRR